MQFTSSNLGSPNGSGSDLDSMGTRLGITADEKLDMYPAQDHLPTFEIRESDELKTVLELYDLDIQQNITRPDYQKLKAIGEEKHRPETSITKFDARKREN